jgi:hypothetical protein
VREAPLAVDVDEELPDPLLHAVRDTSKATAAQAKALPADPLDGCPTIAESMLDLLEHLYRQTTRGRLAITSVRFLS